MEDYIELYTQLTRLSIDNFTSKDFYADNCGTIFNKHFYEKCSLLFIIWQDETTPIMVHNGLAKENTSKDEFEDLISIWGGTFYYNKKKHPTANPYSKLWNKKKFPKLQKHMYILLV